MSTGQHDQWRALADAATPGPWESATDGWVDTPSGDGEDWTYVRPVGSPHEITATMLHGQELDEQAERDHAFIAAAREAVPALLDEVARLTAERDMWQRQALDLGAAGAEQFERAEKAEAAVQALEHFPRALEMANERADRWRERCNTARAESQRLRDGIAALAGEACWTFRTSGEPLGITCLDVIGGTFENGAVFGLEMGCLPCRLRALLAGGEG